MEQYLNILWNELNNFLFNGITGMIGLTFLLVPTFFKIFGKQNRFLKLMEIIGETIVLIIIFVLLIRVLKGE